MLNVTILPLKIIYNVCEFQCSFYPSIDIHRSTMYTMLHNYNRWLSTGKVIVTFNSFRTNFSLTLTKGVDHVNGQLDNN